MATQTTTVDASLMAAGKIMAMLELVQGPTFGSGNK